MHAPNYISESPALRDKLIDASFVVIALTVHELWVPRDVPTQREQSIVAGKRACNSTDCVCTAIIFKVP